MKAVKHSQVAVFVPVKITIVIESQEELDMIKTLTGGNWSNSQYLRDKNNWNYEQTKIVDEFFSQIYNNLNP